MKAEVYDLCCHLVPECLRASFRTYVQTDNSFVPKLSLHQRQKHKKVLWLTLVTKLLPIG